MNLKRPRSHTNFYPLYLYQIVIITYYLIVKIEYKNKYILNSYSLFWLYIRDPVNANNFNI